MMKLRHTVSLILLFSILSLSPAVAQQDLQPLPIDTSLIYGQLENGMTYYIRRNAQPKERADFYIVQNVGSVLEEENQRGLAHFLEHMAFNGSKHFPATAMDDFVESVGMRLGENLNAYTGFDETVYMIMNAPMIREGVLDSCLLILHDWSNYLLLEDEKIEKERGIIREEWRTGQDAQARLWEQQLPKIFPESRYANRLPIGSIDVINNFKGEELRDYYRKWYRPDLQAIVVVGDIDERQVEEKVKALFSKIPAHEHPAERIEYDVPDSNLPLVSVATDKEESNTIVYLFYKHDKMPREMYGTVTGMVKDYIQSVCGTMMNERLSEMLVQADAPFLYAEAGDGDYMVARTKEAWTMAAMVEEGKIEAVLTTLVNETQRVLQYGFTPSEYERARVNLLKTYESYYNERDNQKNSFYANQYISHFTEGGYIPGIETEYLLMNQIAPQIPVEQVNRYLQDMISEDNIVISVTGPDKEELAYPTEEELLISYLKAKQMAVEPYEERLSDDPLIAELPEPGAIKQIDVNTDFEAVCLTLNNGVKVVLKPTEFKQDQVLMTATSPGGSTLFGDEEAANLKVLNDVIGWSALGNFSRMELDKKLAGLKVSCEATLGLDNESLNGSASPKDIETLFQLIYLHFTDVRKDQNAYDSFVSRTKAMLQSLELNPMVAVSDTLTRSVYMDNKRAERLKPADFEQISYTRILEMYHERFADASDFLFTFVGNINVDQFVDLAEQYLATLPTLDRKEQPDKQHIPSIRSGKYENHFTRSMEVPKATVINFTSGQMEYSLKNQVMTLMLEQILDLVYTEKIREDQGATYGVQVSVRMSDFPEGQTTMQIFFDTDPALRKQMSHIIRGELRRIRDLAPREEDFRKTVDNLLKRHAEQLQENSYWLNALDIYYYRGLDRVTHYEEVVKAITPEDLQQFLRELMQQENHIEVVMEP
ncbi:insulinase family protein [Parabacteroides sp. OttesenSCG-928-N08]|nr:insulinase family protein [Parabacteroides sp. OttesenSCG-928-N08]